LGFPIRRPLAPSPPCAPLLPFSYFQGAVGRSRSERPPAPVAESHKAFLTLPFFPPSPFLTPTSCFLSSFHILFVLFLFPFPECLCLVDRATPYAHSVNIRFPSCLFFSLPSVKKNQTIFLSYSLTFRPGRRTLIWLLPKHVNF